MGGNVQLLACSRLHIYLKDAIRQVRRKVKCRILQKVHNF
jgi:hypothetical protein